MTADAAHVAAVAEAFLRADWKQRYREQLAALAVETLTPLIRAQVAAEIRAGASYCPEECLTCVRCVRVGALEDAARIAEGSGS